MLVNFHSRVTFSGQRWCFRLALAGMAVSPLSLDAQNPDLPYTSPSTGADGALAIPAVLPAFGDFDAPIDAVYNEDTGSLFVIGRDVPRAPNTNDGTVTYEYVDGTWIYHSEDNEEFEYSLVYDKARRQLIKIGYYDEDFRRYFGETQVWTGDGWDYFDSDFPYSMGLPGLVYDDARSQVVLFGGYNDDDDELGYTLLWDGTSWTEPNPDPAPARRVRPAMAYDPVREEVVLFGGDDSSAFGGSLANFDDTWTWDGSSWTEKTPTNVPVNGYPAMAWDPNRNAILLVVFDGNADLETWEWNGSDWSQLNPTQVPPGRKYFDIVYDPSRNGIVLFNGDYEDTSIIADTWLWDGTDWSQVSKSPYVFDMTEKPDGIWNFTTIEIGNTRVLFERNADNTPVVWHASGQVRIDGDLILNGEAAVGMVLDTPPYTRAARGGPGGFDGGLGGYYVNADGADQPGFPGEGPGGGLPSMPGDDSGSFDGGHGQHYGKYDSPDLQSFRGGSGGAGTATSTWAADSEWGRGANGGGGGGAILITSSRDILLNGNIEVEGGRGGREFYQRSGFSGTSSVNNYGGSGSGGAIRLVADRVLRTSSGRTYVSADRTFRHDYFILDENSGIMTTEAYFENISYFERSEPFYFSFQPRQTLSGQGQPVLTIDQIAGQAVSLNPSGDPASPDVTFSSAGDVQITVSSSNLTDGRLVSLRVVIGPQVIEPSPQALSGGSATFNVTVPAGSGKIWAWTTWEDQP